MEVRKKLALIVSLVIVFVLAFSLAFVLIFALALVCKPLGILGLVGDNLLVAVSIAQAVRARLLVAASLRASLQEQKTMNPFRKTGPAASSAF